MKTKKIFMTRSEVASLLMVQPRSVSNMKDLVPIRINSRLIRYKVADVEAFIGEAIFES